MEAVRESDVAGIVKESIVGGVVSVDPPPPPPPPSAGTRD